jgi:hypothetical protein
MKITFTLEAISNAYENFMRDPEIHVSTKDITFKKFEECLGIVHVANFYNKGRYVQYNVKNEPKFIVSRARYNLW